MLRGVVGRRCFCAGFGLAVLWTAARLPTDEMSKLLPARNEVVHKKNSAGAGVRQVD